MTLSELLLSLCDTYPQNLSDDVYDRQVYLRIKSEKLNCDVEIPLVRYTCKIYVAYGISGIHRTITYDNRSLR